MKGFEMKKSFDKMTHVEQFVMTTAIFEGKKGTQLIEKIQDAGEHDGMYDVVLTVNGIEVDFEKFVKSLEVNYGREVLEKATEMAVGLAVSKQDFMDALRRGLHNIEFAKTQLETSIEVLESGQKSDWENE
jgi:hypothetical protein